MNTSGIKSIFQTIKKNFHCPGCGADYLYSNIHVIDVSGGVCFLRLVCNCKTPVLASVSINDSGLLQKEKPKIETNELLLMMKKIDNSASITSLINNI